MYTNILINPYSIVFGCLPLQTLKSTPDVSGILIWESNTNDVISSPTCSFLHVVKKN